MPNLVDRTGTKYGRLSVLRRDAERPPATHGARVYWICRCDCGSEVSRSGHELASGDTVSCGCFRREHTGAKHRTHGQTRTPTYSSWQAAKQRCFDPAVDAYRQYGGRGITMCDRWRDSFEAFVSDMGTKPRGTSLDRIDVDGNYEPGNCRWATLEVQAANRRGVGHLWNGEVRTIKAIAAMESVPRTSLNKALVKLGSIEPAVAYCREHTKPPSLART